MCSCLFCDFGLKQDFPIGWTKFKGLLKTDGVFEGQRTRFMPLDSGVKRPDCRDSMI